MTREWKTPIRTSGERPEATLVHGPSKSHPDQIRAEVVAANGVDIAIFPTLYNNERDLRRAVELTHIATGDFLDAHPVVEVIRISDEAEQ